MTLVTVIVHYHETTPKLVYHTNVILCYVFQLEPSYAEPPTARLAVELQLEDRENAP
jgi:hypothetical protein